MMLPVKTSKVAEEPCPLRLPIEPHVQSLSFGQMVPHTNSLKKDHDVHFTDVNLNTFEGPRDLKS